MACDESHRQKFFYAEAYGSHVCFFFLGQGSSIGLQFPGTGPHCGPEDGSRTGGWADGQTG